MGFVLEEGTYLRDGWNKLDFIVVSVGYTFILYQVYFSRVLSFTTLPLNNMMGLRTIRLLRPLRSINKIKGIRVIVKSFIYSIPPLVNVALFLLFIVLVLATFGLHLFSGFYEYRCRLTDLPPTNPLEDWELVPDFEHLCAIPTHHNYNKLGYCPVDTFCRSPWDYDHFPFNRDELRVEGFNYDITGFDNAYKAILSVIQTMTGEGWTDMMYTLW